MTAKVREFNRQFYAAMVIYSTKIHTSKLRIGKTAGWLVRGGVIF